MINHVHLGGLNKGLKRKLQIAQNKVIRFINQLGPRSRITSDILMNINLLNVETRVKQLRLNHVRKIFYNLFPLYLKDIHHHNTRSSGYNFFVPNCQGIESSTFYYTGIKDWNSLPEWLKQMENPQKFKIALKKYLIEHCSATEEDIFLFY